MEILSFWFTGNTPHQSATG